MKSRTLLVIMMTVAVARAETLTLSAAQERLFAGNLDIAAASLEVKKAQAELDEARGSYLPSLDLLAAYNYFTEKNSIDLPGTMNPIRPGTPIHASIGEQYNETFGVDLTWPLFVGFSRRNMVESKRTAISSKEASLAGLRNRQSFALGVLYLQWLLSYRQMDVRKALVTQLTSYAGQVKAMVDAGTALKSRLLDAQARLQLATIDITSAQDQADSLRTELLSLIQDADTLATPDSSDLKIDKMQIPERLDLERPELQTFVETGRQLEWTRRALRGQKLPSIVGTTGYRYALPGLNMGGSKLMDYGVVGIAAKWNLFDGFKNREQAAQLSRQIEILDVARKQVADQFTRSFTVARDQLTNADSRVAATVASRDAARALAAELKEQVSGGTATSADYLNALTAQSLAELAVEQARTTKRMAMLKLLYAAGKEIKF
jgi:outer membrane protein, adhesin transport system